MVKKGINVFKVKSNGKKSYSSQINEMSVKEDVFLSKIIQSIITLADPAMGVNPPPPPHTSPSDFNKLSSVRNTREKRKENV